MLLQKKIVAATPTTFSPTKKGSDVVLSINNTRASLGKVGSDAFSNVSHKTGKWYVEFIATQFEGGTSNGPLFGVGTASTPLSSPWSGPGELIWFCTGTSSQLIYGNNVRFNYGTPFVQGDTVGLAVDLDASTLYFIRNGTVYPTYSLTSYLTGFTKGQDVWFLASSAASLGITSIADIVQTPRYQPSGFSLW